jgi:5-methylcytosine-specific restriction protein A
VRQEFSAKVKAAAALRANGSCEGCSRRLYEGDFNYDHRIPDGLDGEPTLENCQVLCRSCHVVKTSKEDVPRIAKAKRNYRKAHGIKKRSSFQTNRDGPFRKRMDGTVERRHTGE